VLDDADVLDEVAELGDVVEDGEEPLSPPQPATVAPTKTAVAAKPTADVRTRFIESSLTFSTFVVTAICIVCGHRMRPERRIFPRGNLIANRRLSWSVDAYRAITCDTSTQLAAGSTV
jgi:hypothetical protein